MDPLHASASTQFQVIAVPLSDINVTTNLIAATSVAEIAGSVAGGLVGLAAILGSAFGIWRYTADKTSRSTEQFADFIRSSLNLKNVDNFDSETGQQFVSFVHNLQSALKTAGLDASTMRVLERQQLANDVADAARNKISSATSCLGQSVITVTDLNDKLQDLVTEVQVLRSGAAPVFNG